MSGKSASWLALTLLSCTGWRGEASGGQIPPDVRRVLECILPTEGFGRHFLYLRRDGETQFHFSEGGIPGTSDAESSERIVNVTVYGRNRTRAIISTAYLRGTKVEISQMPYFLKKTKYGWEVTDGEGGPGTFDAVAGFVGSFDAKPPMSIRLESEEHDWCRESPL